MSSIRVEVDPELLDRLRALEEADIAGAMAAAGEAIRTSTLERFSREKDREDRRRAGEKRLQYQGGLLHPSTSRVRPKAWKLVQT